MLSLFATELKRQLEFSSTSAIRIYNHCPLVAGVVHNMASTPPRLPELDVTCETPAPHRARVNNLSSQISELVRHKHASEVISSCLLHLIMPDRCIRLIYRRVEKSQCGAAEPDTPVLDRQLLDTERD